MFEFLQKQPSEIIVVVVLNVAAAVLLTTRMIVRRCPHVAFSTIVPAAMTTGLITSLLLGFVFQRAWEYPPIAGSRSRVPLG